MLPEAKDIPVFILCGGLGTRIKEETEFRPKPMVPIGGKPILWHIMSCYRKHGFRKFILCLGFKAELIKEYFLNYHSLNSDFTIDLATGKKTFHGAHHPEDWEVTLAYTGEKSMTGARIARAAKQYLGESDHFAVTYGDGLTDANLLEEYQFHLSHGKKATILGVIPPSRFGEVSLDGNEVTHFCEKPAFEDKKINGGYFFFKKEALSFLTDAEECVLEKEPLTNLAKAGELNMYKHGGFWACMDTMRDREQLETMIENGKTPWLT